MTSSWSIADTNMFWGFVDCVWGDFVGAKNKLDVNKKKKREKETNMENIGGVMMMMVVSLC